jgi:hypothetical protein
LLISKMDLYVEDYVFVINVAWVNLQELHRWVIPMFLETENRIFSNYKNNKQIFLNQQ